MNRSFHGEEDPIEAEQKVATHLKEYDSHLQQVRTLCDQGETGKAKEALEKAAEEARLACTDSQKIDSMRMIKNALLFSERL